MDLYNSDPPPPPSRSFRLAYQNGENNNNTALGSSVCLCVEFGLFLPSRSFRKLSIYKQPPHPST
jgi:hypothetical protein